MISSRIADKYNLLTYGRPTQSQAMATEGKSHSNISNLGRGKCLA